MAVEGVKVVYVMFEKLSPVGSEGALEFYLPAATLRRMGFREGEEIVRYYDDAKREVVMVPAQDAPNVPCTGFTLLFQGDRARFLISPSVAKAAGLSACKEVSVLWSVERFA